MRKSYAGVRWTAPSDLIDEVRGAERRALARELHDTVIQPLAALITSLECVQYQLLAPGVSETRISAWTELAREAMTSLRGTLADLHAHPHAALGLPEALRTYLAPQLFARGLRMTLDIANWPDELPLDVTTGLYLAIREALTNVEKHAHASEVMVHLRATARHLVLIVADDGIGLKEEEGPSEAPSRGSGLGIEGMRERVRALGGKLMVVSAPGQGVRIEMRLPRRRVSARAH